MDPVDALGLVDLALSLCKTIYDMVGAVKANKQLCRELADRVKSLEELVLSVRGRSGPISSPVHKALEKLCENLESARSLMVEFSSMKTFSWFVKSGSLKAKFQDVDRRLSDNLHMLSGALLVEQREVLHDVYATVRGATWCPAPPKASKPPPGVETAASPSVLAAAAPVRCVVSPLPVYGFMTPISCPPTIISISTQLSPQFLRSLQAPQSLISLNQVLRTTSAFRR